MLDIVEERLDFLMAARCGHAGELSTVDVLHVVELTNRLVSDSFLVMASLGNTTLALTVLDARSDASINLAPWTARLGSPGRLRGNLLVLLEVKSGRSIFL